MKALRCRTIWLFVWLGSLGLFAQSALAQSPAGPETLVNDRIELRQAPAQVACEPSGVCAVIWEDHQPIPDSEDFEAWILARAQAPTGSWGPVRELSVGEHTFNPTLTASGTGFLPSWEVHPPDPASTVLLPVSADLQAQGGRLLWQGRSSDYYGAAGVLALPEGFAVLWRWNNFLNPDPIPDCIPCNEEPRLTFLSPQGAPVRPDERVPLPDDVHLYEGLDLIRWPQPGAPDRLLAAYIGFVPNASGSESCFARSFASSGGDAGPQIRLHTAEDAVCQLPWLAAAPDGRWVAAWSAVNPEDGLVDVYARRFDVAGAPLGPEFRVNQVTLSEQFAFGVAMDAQGNFVVAWSSYNPAFSPATYWDAKARLYRADGTPVGNEIYLNHEKCNDQIDPKVAFASNGTFFAAWVSYNQAGHDSLEDIYARRFSASPGLEVCWLAGGDFACDLGGSGGAPEVGLRAGWALGGVPLFGDFDGDGRADLCSYQAGELLCDLDHDGRPLEARERFGGAGDVPLLGDVDGDGRADLCLYRGRHLGCDTGHDGGMAELEMRFGEGGATPLLGDVDGDGRADLCLFSAGRWSCRSWTGATLERRFGSSESQPALADFDGDGKAELCALSGRFLACQPSGPGPAAELARELALPPGATLLIGNLDGL